LAIVVAANAILGSRRSVNAFTVREHSPAIGESHTAAACGSLKSFLQRRAPSLMHANPTARQRVDRSSPFYKRTLTISAKSHIAAACGPFKSFLQHERSQANQKSHSAAACGSFKPFLQTNAYYQREIPQRGSVWIVQVLSTNTRTNRHARESHSAAACGSFKSFLQHERSQANQKSHSAAACGSFKSFLQTRAPSLMLANPTARQRVDRSRLFYKHAHKPSCSRIPQRGSVWIVQVLSTSER